LLKTNNYGTIDGKIEELKSFKERNEIEFVTNKLTRLVYSRYRLFIDQIKKLQNKYVFYTNKAFNLFTNLNKTLKKKCIV